MDISLTVADEARALSSNGVISLEVFASAPHPALTDADDTLSIEERLTLGVALAALSERERRIIKGVVQHGLSQAELARSLGISQSQVSKIYTRAVARMRNLLA